MEGNKILVLSVDRDNDIGRKTNFKGPIIGREDVLKCANQLGLKDPEDSDFNAIFESVKIYDELKKKKQVEIAIITGHENRGMEADIEISKQLNSILKQFQAEYVFFVTDGADDEHVLPIIQSKIPVMSVRRVVVKQSGLESGYYQLKDFITETLENPKYARLVFGLPAIALVLIALFGFEGWRIIIGALGIYLFIRGFKLEEHIGNAFDEIKTSLMKRRFSFFFFFFFFIIFLLGTYRGYMIAEEFMNIGYFEVIAAYLSGSVYIYLLSLTALWFGKNLHAKIKNERKFITVPVFGFSISLVIYSAADIILNPHVTFIDFSISIVIAFIIMFIALMVERYGQR